MLLFENFVIPEMTIPAKKKQGIQSGVFFLVTFLFGALLRTARRARRGGQYFRGDKSVK